MYIASQIREGDLDEFLAHENQAYPPSLSNMGKLRSGTESDLVNCLEDKVLSTDSCSPTPEVIILDGPAIVNMLKPGAAKTFEDYANQVFKPYIMSHLKNASRLDVVWDEYFPDNLKTEARSKRGKGTRRRVEPLNAVPPNWQQFLRISANKSELFLYLATTIMSGESDKQIISTLKNEVRCIQPRDVSGLAPCTHEEAFSSIILHMHDAVCQRYTKILIRTVDADVVVLAVAAAGHIDAELGLHLELESSFDI